MAVAQRFARAAAGVRVRELRREQIADAAAHERQRAGHRAAHEHQGQQAAVDEQANSTAAMASASHAPRDIVNRQPAHMARPHSQNSTFCDGRSQA